MNKFEGVQVLVIDDSAESLEIISDWFLQQFNYKPFVALNLEEAIACLNSENVGYVISDYELPDGNGLEVLNHIKTKSMNIPFILFSGRFDLKLHLSPPFIEAILDKSYEKLFALVLRHLRL